MRQAVVRVRYAPSPTGYLHLGGLRTALFNYVYARQHGGTFILRIEDTDQTRLVPGSAEELIRTLSLCGLAHDEGPVPTEVAGQLKHVGGFGPYIQSQRLPLYATWAERLVDRGHAYRCFCSAERLAKLREDQQRRGVAMLYDRACARLPASEVAVRLAAGSPSVVRLLMPAGATTVSDEILGDVRFANATIDDQVRSAAAAAARGEGTFRASSACTPPPPLRCFSRPMASPRTTWPASSTTTRCAV